MVWADIVDPTGGRDRAASGIGGDRAAEAKRHGEPAVFRHSHLPGAVVAADDLAISAMGSSDFVRQSLPLVGYIVNRAETDRIDVPDGDRAGDGVARRRAAVGVAGTRGGGVR